MYCDNCGNKLIEGAAFCIKCGKSVHLTDIPAESVTRPHPISDTGTDNRERRYNSINRNSYTGHFSQKRGKKKLYFILAGGLLLLIIGGYLTFAAIAGARPFYDRKPITANEFYLHYKAVEDLQVTSDDFGYLPIKSTTTVCYKAYNNDVNIWFYEFGSEGEARNSIKELVAQYPDNGEIGKVSFDKPYPDKLHFQWVDGKVMQEEYGLDYPGIDVCRLENTVMIAQTVPKGKEKTVVPGSTSAYQIVTEGYPDYSEANIRIGEEMRAMGYWFHK